LIFIGTLAFGKLVVCFELMRFQVIFFVKIDATEILSDSTWKILITIINYEFSLVFVKLPNLQKKS